MAGPKRKNKKKRPNRREVDDEGANIVKQLKNRYGKKAGAGDDEGRSHAVLSRQTGKLVNPRKHEDIIQKCIQARLNRINTPVEPEFFLPTVWRCALCGRQSCADELGDLFGPYYVKGAVLPQFLRKARPPPRDEFDFLPVDEQYSSDIWMHGPCAVWAEGLVFFGGQFPKLRQKLEAFWRNSCSICGDIGASVFVTRTSSYVHYTCAKENGYRFVNLTFRCEPPLRPC